MTAPIRAITTHYNGFRFRSRLEARWALFMDKMGVKYEYEPEGFKLDGLFYLPDFYLPLQDCFFEIKSPFVQPVDEKKMQRLVAATKKNLYLMACSPVCPSLAHWYEGEGATLVCWNEYVDMDGKRVAHVGEDYHYLWCECPHCGRCELQFDGRADRIHCSCPRSDHGDKGYNYDSPRLVKAYHAALSATFDKRGEDEELQKA